MQRAREPPAVAHVNFKEGLDRQALGSGAWGPRPAAAPGGAPGCHHAQKPSDEGRTEEGTEKSCSESPPWRLLGTLSLVSSAVPESLHRLKLLPCWSAAWWRPQPPAGATAGPGPWSCPLGWEAVPVTGWRVPLRLEGWPWCLAYSSGCPGDWGGLSSGAEDSVGRPSCPWMGSWSLWPCPEGGQPRGL